MAWLPQTNYANGAAAAEIIGDALDGKGKVAILRWGFHVFQTEQRRDGGLPRLRRSILISRLSMMMM